MSFTIELIDMERPVEYIGTIDSLRNDDDIDVCTYVSCIIETHDKIIMCHSISDKGHGNEVNCLGASATYNKKCIVYRRKLYTGPEVSALKLKIGNKIYIKWEDPVSDCSWKDEDNIYPAFCTTVGVVINATRAGKFKVAPALLDGKHPLPFVSFSHRIATEIRLLV